MANALHMRSTCLTRHLSVLALACLFTLATAPAAFALDQQFVAAQGEWTGPAGSKGVIFKTGPARIWVDADGNAVENSPPDTYHDIPGSINSTWTLRLSPTRRVMIATWHENGVCPYTGTTHIQLFAIPRSSVPLTPLGVEHTLTGCPNPTQFFDPDTTAPYRTAVFPEVGQDGTNPHYLWWSLVTGAANSTSTFLYPTGYVEFAPSGTMAVVQHDLNGHQAGGTNYSLMTLRPADIGQGSIPGYDAGAGAGVLRGWVVPGTPNWTVVYRNNGTYVADAGSYTDCGDPVGGCCKGDGTCSNTTQSACSGVWHSEAVCADLSCPNASLHVSMTGPASAERGAPVTYTLTTSNSGALASSGVVVTDLIPTSSTFVSASAGGTFSAATSKVTWDVGTLGAGQQTSFTVTVRAPCFGSSMVNLTYSITGSPGGAVAGSPMVTTTLTAPNTAGLTLTLLSTALDPVPLQTGGRVRQTIRMQNSLAIVRGGISFSVNAGAASQMLQVVNAGGGTANLTTTSLSWTGTLPASSTTDVVYDTQIKECRSGLPTVEVINNGGAVFVRDVCSTTLVFALPTQTIAVAPSPFSARIESPSHGPVQSWGANGDNRMIVCRPGQTVDLDLLLLNASGAASPSANIALTLPAELPAATDPPFIGSPPAGTLWDSGLHRISWTGTIPANDSIRIRFHVIMSAGDCSGELDAIGGFGSCVNFLQAVLTVHAIPVPPATMLLSLHNLDGLWYQDPAVSTTWMPLLCGNFEIQNGFGRTPDGSFWVAGIPSFRLNPYNLAFEILPPSLFTSMDIDFLYDAAGDMRDSSVVFGGYRTGIGLRLRRYQPRTHQITTILNDTNPQTLGIARHVTVSPDGIIGVNTNNRVLRIDPANPAAYQTFLPPGGGSISGLCLDLDGNWLTCNVPGSSGAARNLMDVDRQTGAYSTIADVHSYFTWFVQMPAITTSPLFDIYLGSGDAVFGKVQRSAGNAVTTSTVPLTINDLMWVGAGVTEVSPRDADVPIGPLELSRPAPNPTRSSVKLEFTLPRSGSITLAVYDLGGRRVRTLAAGAYEAGRHAMRWDGRSDTDAPLGAGLYFVKLHSADGERTAKLVLAH